MLKKKSNHNSLPNWNNRIAEEYVDIWGNKKVIYNDGRREITNGNGYEKQIPGTILHVFMQGYCLINEDGIEVSCYDQKEADRLASKYEFKAKLRTKFREEFKGWRFYEGPNNSVALNDREVVPDCYWGLPTNEEEVENKYEEILSKVLDYQFGEDPIIDFDVDDLP